MTKKTKNISLLLENTAFRLFCYHRIWYTICVQIAYFISRFNSIFGLGLLIFLLVDVQLQFKEEFVAVSGECVPINVPLYSQYIIKLFVGYLMYFIFFLCFPALDFQLRINNFLTYFYNSFIRLHWKKSSRFYFRYRRTVTAKQIRALESCRENFPKLVLHEFKTFTFEKSCKTKLCRTPPSFTMTCRIINGSLFIYFFFEIFVNHIFYPVCLSYLHKNYFNLEENMDSESTDIIINFFYYYNICAAGVLLGYLMVLQFPTLI